MKNLVFCGAILIIVLIGSCKDSVSTGGVVNPVDTTQKEKMATLQYTLTARKDDDIKDVSWNADGSMLATVGTNSFSVWNTATGQVMYTIYGDGPLQNVHICWSPDGQRLATSCDDYAPAGFDIGLISIRNATDGKVIWTLGKNITLSSPDCMSWSSDGKFLSTSEGTLINIWNPDKGYLYNTVRGHTSSINQIFWSIKNNGTYSIHSPFSSSDKEIIVWNSIADEKLFTLNGHSGEINDIDLSSDGTRIVSGSDDKTAIIWDVATGKKLFTLLGHTQDITDLSWSPDCSKIITGSHDYGSIIWDASKGTKLFRLDGDGEVTITVAWSPDSKRVVTNSWKNAFIWDAATGKKTLTLSGHTGLINKLCWSPDGKRVATASADGTIKIWLVGEFQ